MSWLTAIGSALWDTGKSVIRTIGQAVLPVMKGVVGDVIDRGRDSLTGIADRGFNAFDNAYISNGSMYQFYRPDPSQAQYRGQGFPTTPDLRNAQPRYTFMPNVSTQQPYGQVNMNNFLSNRQTTYRNYPALGYDQGGDM